MEVILEGQADLLKALDKFGKDAIKEATEGLKKAGMQIVADAQTNLRQNGNNTTGRLSNSGNVITLKDGSVEAGFMQVPQGAQANYAEYLEAGTKPHKVSGKWFNVWASKKFGLHPADGRAAVSAGWAVAKSIAKKGTKAHPYFAPAVKKNEKKVIECLQNALNKAIQKNTR